MELKKYKLGEIADIYNGSTPSTTDSENYDGDIIWVTPKDLSEQKSKYLYKGARNISQKGYDNCSTQMIPAYNILMSSRAPIGLFTINKVECCTNQGFKNIVLNKNAADVDYMYYYLKFHVKEIEALGSGTTFKEVSKQSLENFCVKLPNLPVQRKIASVLSSLDSKIALNRRINAKLEQIAKRLYDYWFVQFNFPNEKGKPYKSSGGKMVWNEALKREVPEGWEVKRLSDFICKNNTGDWGADEPTDKTIEVGCIRGADIIALNDLPKRFIKSTNTEKLLSEWDMVIEVSGGSPVQATGRCALITPGVIKRNGNKITCSNFCHAFSFKDYWFSAYFYYLWKMFYDNGIMFNYEGKTSGIKNFMTETFLANKWVSAPETLAEKFFGIVKETYAKIDTNIAENNKLIALRDKLLPLLMNGQVEVKG
ncbi:MAG: restriction endonuclease subunit S [Bacteroidales bacterium]|nr:restriction endonuclease subunit S [Bacteroidales bacterium]